MHFLFTNLWFRVCPFCSFHFQFWIRILFFSNQLNEIRNGYSSFVRFFFSLSIYYELFKCRIDLKKKETWNSCFLSNASVCVYAFSWLRRDLTVHQYNQEIIISTEADVYGNYWNDCRFSFFLLSRLLCTQCMHACMHGSDSLYRNPFCMHRFRCCNAKVYNV